jgi:cephalosporin hydroxylase
MRITVDTAEKLLSIERDGLSTNLDLYGKEAFEVVSDLWLRMSWNQKYSYTFTWLGRPIIQHPEDLVRLQEAIYTLRPDVVIETGVAHGGSLIFDASLFKAMGHGRKVIGVDIEIRSHNRRAIESHELSSMIALVEGDSVAPETITRVSRLILPQDKVLVILDSDHSYKHVMAELEAYQQFVSPGSYIVATDGIMREVTDTPLGKPGWTMDNPANAAEDFVKRHSEFAIEEPVWRFNESQLEKSITAWPSAWLRRNR